MEIDPINTEEVKEVQDESSSKKVQINGESQDLPEDPENSSSPSKAKEIDPFPFARFKRLMQCGGEETYRSDTVKLLMKATDLFIQELAQKSESFSKSKNKKTIFLNDIIDAVNMHENLTFIRDSGILTESFEKQEKKSKKPKSEQQTLIQSELNLN